MTSPHRLLSPPCWGKPSRPFTAPPPEEPAQWYITKVAPKSAAPDEIGKELAPQPAQARSGSAFPSASQHASMISHAGKTVHMVSGAGGSAFTSDPSGAMIRTLWNEPSLRGSAGSKNDDSAA